MSHQLELPIPSRNRLVRGAGGAGQARPPLSPRRRHVLALYLCGYQRRQIARRLGVSPNTIRNHIREVYDSAGVSNKIEALRWALAQPALAEQIMTISDEETDRDVLGAQFVAAQTPPSFEEAVSEAVAYFQRLVVETPMEAPRW